ncbi:MAG: ABC transporter permease [Parasporobacterium sp.]|nr:ABC transporter permease [Parasporobacterium sp.]
MAGKASAVRVIFNKEIKKVFQDRRMLVLTVFMPGTLLFAIYSALGLIMSDDMISELSSTETGTVMSAVIPVFLMIFLFMGCIGAASETIAGEKERGTMTSLLKTPVKRSHIALGKILAMSVVAAASGISSLAGLFGALMVITGGMTVLTGIQIMTFTGVIAVITIVSAAAVMLVGTVTLVSAASRTAKEAQVFTMPLVLAVTMVCILAAMPVPEGDKIWIYMIPVVNNTKCLLEIFSGVSDLTHIFVTAAVSIAVTGLEVMGLSHMFGNEKIMV